MEKIKKNYPKDEKEENNAKKANTINLLQVGIQFGLILALPLLGCIALGLYLDKKYNTLPLFIIIGLFLALGISSYALYKKINQIIISFDNHKK